MYKNSAQDFAHRVVLVDLKKGDLICLHAMGVGRFVVCFCCVDQDPIYLLSEGGKGVLSFAIDMLWKRKRTIRKGLKLGALAR